MPTITIFDTESDGLADVATKLWCIATSDYHDAGVRLYGPESLSDGLLELSSAKVLVCHNALRHDLRLLQRVYGWKPHPDQIIVDTLVFSRMNYPKRPNPDGYTGKAPHSIEAWGYRVGRGKPEHEDWTQWSEAMGIRCQEDVEINKLVLQELEREVATPMFYHKDDTKRRTKA